MSENPETDHIPEPETGQAAIGKTCPYCQTPIKPGVPVFTCEACAISHHEACWSENGGCTTFGCSNAPAPRAPARPEPAAPPPGEGGARVARSPKAGLWIGTSLAATAVILIVFALSQSRQSAAPPTPLAPDAGAPVAPAPRPRAAQPSPFAPQPRPAPPVENYRGDADAAMRAFDDVQNSVDTGGDLGDFVARYDRARQALGDFDAQQSGPKARRFSNALHNAAAAYADGLAHWQREVRAEEANDFAAAQTHGDAMRAAFRQAEGYLDDARVLLENE